MTLYIPSYHIAKDTQLNTLQDIGKKKMMKIKERQEMLLLPYTKGLDVAKYLDTILNSTRVKHKDHVLYNVSSEIQKDSVKEMLYHSELSMLKGIYSIAQQNHEKCTKVLDIIWNNVTVKRRTDKVQSKLKFSYCIMAA